MTDAFRAAVVIPVYDHPEVIRKLTARIAGAGLPVILVNDGSHEPCASVLRQTAREVPGTLLHELPCNGGKGAACIAGMRVAHARGFTHAVQVDADGQHDLAALEPLLACARAHPADLICGVPEYDASAPKSRLYGRKITNFWVAVNTLGRCGAKDAMLGFRVYPLERVMTVLPEVRSLRMEFDAEILVRAAWAGIGMRNVPVRVIYPEGGVSHFHMLGDNAAISLMHARLFFGMLARVPRLLSARH